MKPRFSLLGATFGLVVVISMLLVSLMGVMLANIRAEATLREESRAAGQQVVNDVLDRLEEIGSETATIAHENRINIRQIEAQLDEIAAAVKSR